MTKQLIKVVCFWQLAWRSIYVFPLSRKWSRVVLLIVTILLISEGISDSFPIFPAIYRCKLLLQENLNIKGNQAISSSLSGALFTSNGGPGVYISF